MRIYKKIKAFISLACAVSMLFTVCVSPVTASDTKSVTATTSASIKQGGSGTCYVYIDSTESLAALDVTVHFDPAKVKINNVYNSVSCTLYDNVKNTDNIQFSYILDGKGSTSKTRLFYFYYQVLSNADVGDTYFDIIIGEAYDNSLKDVAVSGSRTSFTITENITTKTCTVSSSSTVDTSVGNEFPLTYRFNTYQIASGSAVITYDPELFEVTEVTNGGFLTNKVTDVNTELSGAVYVSFVGTEYNTKYDFITIKFKTLKNVSASSKITFKATELCDKDLNAISCSDCVTTAKITFDDTYVGDAPKMSVLAKYNSDTKKVTAVVSLEEKSNLGAGDFVIGFDPASMSLASYEKGFLPSFFNVNDKETAEGKLKFSIISMENITASQTVLTVVFDANITCDEQLSEISISGSMLSDAMTNSILLNFISDSVVIPGEHAYGDWVIDKNATTTEAGVKYKECSSCGDIITEEIPKIELFPQIVTKGHTLEYKDMIYVKMIYNLIDIDLSVVDITKDAGILYWTEEEFAALEEISFDETHAMAGLEIYPNTSFYYGKTEGIFTKYLADVYYFVGYVKLPDGDYVFSDVRLYGPTTYAYNMIGKDSAQEKTKQLCIALLNYTTAAQKYFYPDIAEDKLANINLTDAQKAMSWSNDEMNFNLAGEIAEDKKVECDSAVFKKIGMNLRFQEMISLISIYQIDASVINSALECGTIFWTAEQFEALEGKPSIDNIGKGQKVKIRAYTTSNTWSSVAPAVAAKNMADTSYYILGYVKHSDGKISYSGIMSYSFEQYIYNKTANADTSAEMAEFAKRLYVYERAARTALN